MAPFKLMHWEAERVEKDPSDPCFPITNKDVILHC